MPVSGSNYKAYFGTANYSGVSNGDGIIPKYSGSSNITDLKLQKLNKKYFTFLNTGTSEKGNIKAVAYMMDTDIWRSFATSNKNFAEFAIGGPTIELLFTAYNKYKGTSYETQVSSNTGYQIRKTTNDSWVNNLSDIITRDTDIEDNPYAMNKQNSYSNDAYWIAYPGNAGNCLMYVYRNNDIDIKYGYQYTGASFRPLILLDSNYTLEKIKDKDGNDAFKIVEQ